MSNQCRETRPRVALRARRVTCLRSVWPVQCERRRVVRGHAGRRATSSNHSRRRRQGAAQRGPVAMAASRCAGAGRAGGAAVRRAGRAERRVPAAAGPDQRSRGALCQPASHRAAVLEPAQRQRTKVPRLVRRLRQASRPAGMCRCHVSVSAFSQFYFLTFKNNTSVTACPYCNVYWTPRKYVCQLVPNKIKKSKYTRSSCSLPQTQY